MASCHRVCSIYDLPGRSTLSSLVQSCWSCCRISKPLAKPLKSCCYHECISVEIYVVEINVVVHVVPVNGSHPRFTTNLSEQVVVNRPYWRWSSEFHRVPSVVQSGSSSMWRTSRASWLNMTCFIICSPMTCRQCCTVYHLTFLRRCQPSMIASSTSTVGLHWSVYS